jgi:hypothetical protein
MFVGLDGGYVRGREGDWFEVIVGKSVLSFRRDDPETATTPEKGKCFAFVQTLDEKPKRRLYEMLRGQGLQPNQQLIFLSDGGDTVRRLQTHLSPEAEHVLDWFHVTMRLTVLRQMVKGAAPTPAWAEDRLRDLERAKWLLWNGHARAGIEAVEDMEIDIDCVADEDAEELPPLLCKLRNTLADFRTYLSNNTGMIVDYGERYRAGERISTGFVESAINQVVGKRFSKSQSMPARERTFSSRRARAFSTRSSTTSSAVATRAFGRHAPQQSRNLLRRPCNDEHRTQGATAADDRGRLPGLAWRRHHETSPARRRRGAGHGAGERHSRHHPGYPRLSRHASIDRGRKPMPRRHRAGRRAAPAGQHQPARPRSRRHLQSE